MAREQSAARHARDAHPLRRLIAVVVTASALVAVIVAVGSALNRHDRDRDAMVTIEPTTRATTPPTGTVDETPPDGAAPTGDPTAASTSGPSPAANPPSVPGGSGGPGSTSPDPTTPGSDPTSPGQPRPGPGSTYPGDPDPPSSPDPDPTPPDDPDPSPDPDPPSDPPSDPPGDPVPVPTLTCAADARVDSSFIVGFSAEVTITNTADNTIVGWTSQFTLPPGYTISKARDGEVVDDDGEHAAVRDDGDNAVIEPGASVTFGITASGIGRPGEPSDIAVNGAACD